jgi:glycogen debranching enzyme
LADPETYGAQYPIPSTPLNSEYFNPVRYWQGPTWINMNWMIAEGLERNGQMNAANTLRSQTVGLIEKTGIYEYYSPLTGAKAGADTFSWSAALYIDLVKRGFSS